MCYLIALHVLFINPHHDTACQNERTGQMWIDIGTSIERVRRKYGDHIRLPIGADLNLQMSDVDNSNTFGPFSLHPRHNASQCAAARTLARSFLDKHALVAFLTWPQQSLDEAWTWRKESPPFANTLIDYVLVSDPFKDSCRAITFLGDGCCVE